ncbi:Asp-tRNA(Asn)/Glu-tRNA(Gln) amidotransferase subunit GatA [Pollutibacter soli]|uniref:Asp-tRNA(Asn)/Glu-tRNA(Gln) amidotransferase subunit GatA n=1 Tax=Pollutibacter soli TaxID=3034157 RepID=UPI003013AE4D
MYSHKSIQQFLSGIEEQTIDCTSVVKHYLARIEEYRHLNAFIDVFADEALTRAAELDNKKKKGLPCGKLFGVVVGIKDVICYKDHHISAGSAILKGFTSLYSATAIERLLGEDAIIIGNLNCDEFAMGSSNENSAYGNVLNALDPTRVSGGSSGGSAVAVQAGLCMVSLGSDTGGSVRQPADFCGVIGFKPGYGRISRYGLIAYASSFDQIGIFGTNIEDIALLVEIMAGPDEYDSTAARKPVPAFSQLLKDTKKFKIAYFPQSLAHPSLDPEIGMAIRDHLKMLEKEGHTVEPVDFELLDYIVPAYYILTTAEASSNLARYDGVKYGTRTKELVNNLDEFYRKSRSQGFGKEVKRRIMLGTFVLSTGYYDAYYTRAQQVRRRIKEQTDLIFKHFDIIILPTTPAPAFRFGEKSHDAVEMFLADLFTVFANLAGIPAISYPLSKHSNGMPFGIQAMTNQFEELSLLQFSNLSCHPSGTL